MCLGLVRAVRVSGLSQVVDEKSEKPALLRGTNIAGT
jgi:hypothetical protein